jgi:nitroreductase
MRGDDSQIFAKPIIEIIKSRSSVRTYNNQPLSTAIKEQIKQYISELEGQLDIKVRFQLIDSDIALKESGARLGTYGMIKGASSFVTAAVAKDHSSNNIERLGYLFEKIVLFATSIGLGTCWVAGTLKREEFSKAINLKDDELLPVITPLGYSNKSMRLQDRMVKLIAGSKKRKSWDELFYDADFQNSLSQSEAREYSVPLEMVRLAPSASNHQPWRIVKDRDAFHFYLSRTKGYKTRFNFDIQKIDVGIAMCHFELTSAERGMAGRWIVQRPDAKGIPDDTEYIASWVATGI